VEAIMFRRRVMRGRVGLGDRVSSRAVAGATTPPRVETLEPRTFLAAQPAGLPEVTLTAPCKNASEAGPAIRRFILHRTGDVSKRLVVNLTVGGTATNRDDYGVIGAAVTFAAGSSEARVAVRPFDDAVHEPRETVTLAVAAGDGYAVGDQHSDWVYLRDNDPFPVDPRTAITWRAVAPSPIWRCESAKAVVEGKMYVFGGFIEGTYGPVTRSDVYDPAANKWTRLADLPTRLTHAASAVDGTKVYLVGGYVGWGQLGQQDYGTTDVWVYDTVADTFSPGPSLPAPRGAGSMVKIGRELHFMGGCDPDRIDRTDHWVLNLDDPEAGWTASVPLPAARNHVGLTLFDGHVFVIGGQVGPDDNTGAKGTMAVWHPLWDAWKPLPDLPAPLSHHNEATLVHEGRIVVLGGIPLGGGSVRAVSAYAPSTGKWTELTPLPAKRYTGVAAVIDDVIYYSGGASSVTYKGVFN
jgi:N-acetylneuraminic acid mutarotase